MDRGGVVAHEKRKLLLQQGRSAPGVVVGDARVDVVAHMGGSNAVVEKVEHPAVGTIHRLQGTLGPSPVAACEVGNVEIGVMQPGVAHQPGIDHQVGQPIHAQHPRW